MIEAHGNAFDAKAKSKSRVSFAVDVAIFKNCRINHATAQNFDPSGMFTNIASFAFAKRAANIHFGRWLGKREVGRTKSDAGRFAVHFTGKI